jgi:Leucine-rich repeat (LRR) protein
MIQLEVLFLNGNKLASLPVEVGRLINLRKVNLSSNQLKDLPATIGLWKALNHLYGEEPPLLHFLFLSLPLC